MAKKTKQAKPAARDLPQLLAQIYLALLLTAFVIYPGAQGYDTIFDEKYAVFLLLSGGYCAVSLLLELELGLTGQKKLSSPAALWRASSWPQRLVVFYLLWTLLATILSPYVNSWTGLSRHEGFFTILIYGVSFLFLSVYGRAKPWMAYALGVGMTVCCGIAVLQIMGGDPLGLYPEGLSWLERTESMTSSAYLGTIGNIDLLSSLLCLAIPVFAVMLWKGEDRRRFLLAVPLALSLYVLAASGVAAGALAVLGTAVITVPLLIKNRRCRIFAFVGAGALVFGGLAAVFFMDAGSGTLHELHELLHGRVADGFGSGRIHIWKQVLSIVPENLLFGLGPDTLLAAELEGFTRYVESENLTLYAMIDTAHNEYLNVLVHQGLPALAAYLGALFVTAGGWLRRARENTALAVTGAAVLCYCIQAFFAISACAVAPLLWAAWALAERERKAIKTH